MTRFDFLDQVFGQVFGIRRDGRGVGGGRGGGAEIQFYRTFLSLTVEITKFFFAAGLPYTKLRKRVPANYFFTHSLTEKIGYPLTINNIVKLYLFVTDYRDSKKPSRILYTWVDE